MQTRKDNHIVSAERVYLWGPVLLAGIAYLPSLFGGFVYDDVSITVLGDPFLQGRINWWEALQSDRPLRIFTYALDKAIWSFGSEGNGMPFGYHLQNLFWHLLCVYLIGHLGKRLSFGAMQTCIAASFFAVHPMGTEAVAWISGRKELLCLAFELLSIAALLACLRENLRKGRSVIFGVLSLICLFLALLSKQVAVMTPFLALILLWLGRRDGQVFDTKKVVILIVSQLALVGILSALQLRAGDALGAVASGNFHDPGASNFERTPLSAALTGLAVWGEVHRLLVLPFDPVLDRIVTPVMVWSDLRWLAGPLWTLAALGLIFFCRRRTSLVLAGYFWIIAAWVPTSGVTPIAYLLADRYLYIPLVGYCLLVAGLWDTLLQRWPNLIRRRFFAIVFLFIVAFMMGRTTARCLDWRDEVTILKRTIEQNGPHPRFLFGLGVAYKNAGDIQAAIETWRRCLEFNPDYKEARVNLALALESEGNLTEAEILYIRALDRDPNYGTAHYNLALLLEKKGKIKEALEHLLLAAETLTGKTDTEFRRAKAYIQYARVRIGQAERLQKENPFEFKDALQESGRALAQALRLSPQSAEAWDFEGRRRALSGSIESAAEAWQRAFEIDPQRPEVCFNLGLYLLRNGDSERGKMLLDRAAELDPKLAEAVKNVMSP